MPQRRNVPPEEHAERIVKALAALKAAHEERDASIADALKAGGSVREVARIAGLSERTIQTIGHDNGWPTDKQRAAWEAEKAERARWQSLIGYAVEQRTQDDT